MSASIYVVGFRPADEVWNRMKGIWEACDAAKVSIPKEVLDFFDGGPPSDKPGAEIEVKAAIKKWNSKDGSGYEVDLDKLPKGVRFLRCYLS